MNYSLRAYAIAEQYVPGWACFFGSNDKAFHRLVFYVWIVQGGGKTVVIDAGPPPDEKDFQILSSACATLDPQCEFRRLCTLESIFCDARVDPHSIDALLVTQPITYCTGGITPDYFPRTRVYMARAGLLEFLLDNPGHPPRNCYFTEETWRHLYHLLVSGRLILPDRRLETVEGVFFDVTGGHHPGSAAVTVKTSRGLVAILETAFLSQNVEQERPIGLAEDVAECRRAIRHYKNTCDLVLAAHDSGIVDLYPGGVIA